MLCGACEDRAGSQWKARWGGSLTSPAGEQWVWTDRVLMLHMQSLVILTGKILWSYFVCRKIKVLKG